jgi:hypothetical protein
VSRNVKRWTLVSAHATCTCGRVGRCIHEPNRAAEADLSPSSLSTRKDDGHFTAKAMYCHTALSAMDCG